MHTKMKFFGMLIITAILLTGCSAIPWAKEAEPTPLPVVTGSANVTSEGRIVPKQFTSLAFLSSGEIENIAVSEGQQVDKDTILVSLGKREQALAAVAQAKLAQLSAQQQLDQLNRLADEARGQTELALAAANKAVSDAQQAYDEINSEDLRDEIEDKQAAVKDAQEELADKQETLDKYLDLSPDNQKRKDAQNEVDDALRALHDAERERDLLQYELDQAKATLDQALGRQKETLRALEARKDGPDADALALAQATMDSAAAQLAAAERALAQMDLLAPYNGIVMKILNYEAGETVMAGQPVITFADTSAWYVETTDLTELDVVRLSEGQAVTVAPDALPEATYTGTIESISKVFTEKSGDVLYTVKIRLQDPDEQLRWGMTVKLTFVE